MGKAKVKLEKSIDTRGVGYTAIDALKEHNAQVSKGVYPPVITKVGLPFYTEKELSKKGGEVMSFNMDKPVTISEFRKMSTDTRKVYVNHLVEKYEGINTTDLAKMMGCSYGMMAMLLRDSGVRFPRGGSPKKSDGRIRFEEEMIPKSVEEEKSDSANTEKTTCLLTSATFHCDVSEVMEVINRLGMTGRVFIKICVSNKGGKQDDGFN